jgi:hypothetical protein
MLAGTMDDGEDALVFQEVAAAIVERCGKVEKKRCSLFRLLHPNRAHFEEVGWPGDAEVTPVP